MSLFWTGLIIGSIFGLALAVLLARVAGSIRWVSGLFGYSDERKRIKELEKRLADKDLYIKKAIESFKKEGGSATLPD